DRRIRDGGEVRLENPLAFLDGLLVDRQQVVVDAANAEHSGVARRGTGIFQGTTIQNLEFDSPPLMLAPARSTTMLVTSDMKSMCPSANRMCAPPECSLPSERSLKCSSASMNCWLSG